MPGHIGQNKHQARQVFRQLSPPLTRSRTCDAATPTQHVDLSHVAEIMRGAATAMSPRDSARGPTIGEVRRSQLTLEKDIMPRIKDIGDRILALEAKRQQQQRTQDHASPCACGTSPCTCSPSLAPKAPTKDTPMKQNLALAPHKNLTFSKPRTVRDSWRFGGQPSRFDSAEQDRLSRYTPPGSAGLPAHVELQRPDVSLTGRLEFGAKTTAASIYEMNRRAHDVHGASGQTSDDSEGMLQLGALARQNKAPAATPYHLDGSDGRGRSPTENNLNERGDLGMAVSVDPNESFANELSKIPSGQPNTAVNALNNAMSKAKTPAVRDSIENIWKSWQARR